MKSEQIIAKRNHKTVYRDGNRAVKVFDATYSKSDILNEALNQARVEETGLKIPKLLEVTTVDGKWAIVSEHIEGKTLAEKMKENPEKKEEILKRFVDLQLEIQSRTCPNLNRLKEKMDRKINEADLTESTRYDLHTRLASMLDHNRVCHGDFDPSNVLETKDGTLYTIDWAHVTQGNPSADAARTYLLFHLGGDEEGADAYLDLFCERSGTDRQYVEKWMPIVAASQSVKGNEREREFLLRWANVVDYS